MYSLTESNAPPADVTVETLPDGGKWVILHRNAEQIETQGDDGAPMQTVYRAEEVAFKLPDGREETEVTIRDGFADWWIYGAEWTHSMDDTPTVEERLASVEAFAAAMLGGAL